MNNNDLTTLNGVVVLHHTHSLPLAPQSTSGAVKGNSTSYSVGCAKHVPVNKSANNYYRSNEFSAPRFSARLKVCIRIALFLY